jgi:hypothetical protein
MRCRHGFITEPVARESADLEVLDQDADSATDAPVLASGRLKSWPRRGRDCGQVHADSLVGVLGIGKVGEPMPGVIAARGCSILDDLGAEIRENPDAHGPARMRVRSSTISPCNGPAMVEEVPKRCRCYGFGSSAVASGDEPKP